MIKSTTAKLKKSDTKLDNTEIENKLSELGYKPVRWAIVGIDDNFYTISLAYSTT